MPARRRETGEVRADAVYSYAGLARCLGWRVAMIRSARRAGLVVRRFGGRPYILGKDLVEFA